MSHATRACLLEAPNVREASNASLTADESSPLSKLRATDGREKLGVGAKALVLVRSIAVVARMNFMVANRYQVCFCFVSNAFGFYVDISLFGSKIFCIFRLSCFFIGSKP